MKTINLFEYGLEPGVQKIVKAIELPKAIKVLEEDHPLLKTLKEGYNYSPKNWKEYIKYLKKVFYKFGKACTFPNRGFAHNVEHYTRYYLKMDSNKNYPKVIAIKAMLKNIMDSFNDITNNINFIMENYFVKIPKYGYDEIIECKDLDYYDNYKSLDNLVNEKGYYQSGRPYYKGIDLLYVYKDIDDIYLKCFDTYKYGC